MSDEQMRPSFAARWAFNFATTADTRSTAWPPREFATALRQDGMLALARLQRKMRLVESPYRTPQTLRRRPAQRRGAGGLARGAPPPPRRWARAPRSTSTRVQTEVPKKLLEDWLSLWSEHYELGEKLRVTL